MESSSLNVRIAELANANRLLISQAQQTDCQCPSAVLNLGASITSLSTLASCLYEHNRFLDEAVLDELLLERRSLADALDLLKTLSEANSESHDIEPLASALVGRIEEFLEREDRAFYQPLLRSASSDSRKAHR